MSDVIWKYQPFSRLTAPELYGIVALRQRVFVVEQNCPYLDADGIDRACNHLWTEELAPRHDSGQTNPATLAYLRVVPPGEKYDEPSLGRVVTAPEARRTGLGRALMTEGLTRLWKSFGDVPVRIGAQKYLERFYASLGFVRASADYLEDGIEHLEMLRNPRR
jgi:ElaA protein